MGGISLKPSSFVQRLVRGISKHPWKTVVSIYIAYAILWSVFEPISAFFPQTTSYGSIKYIILLAAGVLIGVLRIAVPAQVRLSVPGSNMAVRIEVGDLLSYPGHKVVAVNEYFDSQLGDHVAPTSLHGQVITKFFNGHASRFQSDVDQALKKVHFTQVSRPSGRNKRYPIGTVAAIPLGNHYLFLAALTHTENETLKAKADAEDLWLTLRNTWKAVRIHGQGTPVAIPLMGSGLADVELPYWGILEVILLSILREARGSGFAREVTIVLTEDAFAQLDLRALVREWST